MNLESILQPYNIQPVRMEKLEGYGSANYRITDSAGSTFVLKYYSDSSDFNMVNAESEIISQIADKVSFQVPVNIMADNRNLTRYKDGSFSRLMPYIEGDLLADVKHTKSLLNNFGKTMAELNHALEAIDRTETHGRKLYWDIQNCLMSRDKMVHIKDPSKRKLANYYLDRYEQFVYPYLHQIRHSLIHSDLNDYNIVSDGKRITGIFDFGDMVHSPLINELATALAYLMFNKTDPLESAAWIINGYTSVHKLEPEEILLLKYLVPAKLCISVCSSAEYKAVNKATDYILISEKPAWELLYKWVKLNPDYIDEKFCRAAGLPSIDKPEIRKYLKKRKDQLAPGLALSYSQPVMMTGAAFQYMYDNHGNTYLDAYNNIAHVGHCHPAVTQAISRQVRLLNTNTRYLYESLTDYTEKLLKYFPVKLNKVFFVNSGSAATDLALRLAGSYTGNTDFLVMEQGYHGNTSAGINISSYKFDGPGGNGLSENVTRLPLPKLYNGVFQSGLEYATDARHRITTLLENNKKPAALIAEPISGCGGIITLAPGYLKSMHSFLKENNILTILDEVQTGFGRLGEFFWGFEMHELFPDIVILGKPMGNGHPVAAVVTTDEIAGSFDNGMEFFSSFGGNPVSCEAARAVLEVIESEDLQQNASLTGKRITEELKNLQQEYPAIGDVRGSGLFIGVELVDKDHNPATEFAASVVEQLKQNFILCGTDGPGKNVLKIKPPMCFDYENIDYLITSLNDIFGRYPQSGIN